MRIPSQEEVLASGSKKGGGGKRVVGTGFVPAYDRETVPRPVYEFVWSCVGQFGSVERLFFLHVLLSGARSRKRDGWVPMWCRLREKEFPGVDWIALVEAGVLEYREYDRWGEKSRAYRVAANVRRAYNDVLLDSAGYGVLRVKLTTGKPSVRKVKSKVNDENRHPYPDLVREGIRGITIGRFNGPAVDAHVAEVRRLAITAEREAERLTGLPVAEAARVLRDAVAAEKRAFAGGEEGSPLLWTPEARAAVRRAERLLGRYGVDNLARASLYAQSTRHLGGGVYEFYPAYEPQSTGRITDVGPRVQSATRELKHAAFGKIADVHNYDITSSQPRDLRALFIEAGIPTDNIDRLLLSSKEENAERIGVNIGAWKGALMALVMCAVLYRTYANGLDRYGDPRGDLIKIIGEGASAEAGGTDQATAYGRFYDLVRPLHRDLKRWRRWLVNVWMPPNTKYGHGGKRYVVNAAGMKLCVDDVRPNRLGRKLAAFVLQGREAAFIHTLTALQADYGFAVIANEHDGLVTVGEIPDEAIEEAKRRRGMPHVKLVPKRFLEPKETNAAA